MKLLCCDLCHDVVKPVIDEWRWCSCKSIGGFYFNNSWMVFARKDKAHQRVIGVDNRVRYGLKKRSYSVIQEPKTAEGKNVNEIEYDLVRNATDIEMQEMIYDVKRALTRGESGGTIKSV